VVVLEYVFNDIDYLRGVTQRIDFLEQPRTVVERLHPIRLAFFNFYGVQELVARTWGMIRSRQSTNADAYSDSALVDRHLADVARLLDLAGRRGANVYLLPVDPTVVLGGRQEERYRAFVRMAGRHGMPVVPVDSAFATYSPSELRVNRLDWHPSVTANRLAAEILARTIAQHWTGERGCAGSRGRGTTGASGT
jgi:hypothetical protein